MKKIIIGSRGSKLALLYAEKARECLLNSSDLSNDDIFMIRLDKVMTMSETTDEKLIQIYNDYIKEEMEEEDSIDTYKSSTGELDGSVKPSSKMGYLSTVEEARVALEDLYKLEDNKES